MQRLKDIKSPKTQKDFTSNWNRQFEIIRNPPFSSMIIPDRNLHRGISSESHVELPDVAHGNWQWNVEAISRSFAIKKIYETFTARSDHTCININVLFLRIILLSRGRGTTCLLPFTNGVETPLPKFGHMGIKRYGTTISLSHPRVATTLVKSPFLIAESPTCSWLSLNWLFLSD